MIVNHQKTRRVRNALGRGRRFTTIGGPLVIVFRWLGNGREPNRKRSAFIPARARSNDCSTMRQNHCFGNGEAKSQPTESASNRALPLFKRVEDFANFVWLNSDSAVADANLDLPTLRLSCLDRNLALCRRQLHAVSDYVPRRLLQ